MMARNATSGRDGKTTGDQRHDGIPGVVRRGTHRCQPPAKPSPSTTSRAKYCSSKRWRSGAPPVRNNRSKSKPCMKKLGMPADLVTIALDIDPNENGDASKTYAANNGFDWIYAVSPADVSREIGNLYGISFSIRLPLRSDDRPQRRSPPAAIRIKSTDDLIKAIEPYLNGM